MFIGVCIPEDSVANFNKLKIPSWHPGYGMRWCWWLFLFFGFWPSLVGSHVPHIVAKTVKLLVNYSVGVCFVTMILTINMQCVLYDVTWSNDWCRDSPRSTSPCWVLLCTPCAITPSCLSPWETGLRPPSSGQLSVCLRFWGMISCEKHCVLFKCVVCERFLNHSFQKYMMYN